MRIFSRSNVVWIGMALVVATLMYAASMRIAGAVEPRPYDATQPAVNPGPDQIFVMTKHRLYLFEQCVTDYTIDVSSNRLFVGNCTVPTRVFTGGNYNSFPSNTYATVDIDTLPGVNFPKSKFSSDGAQCRVREIEPIGNNPVRYRWRFECPHLMFDNGMEDSEPLTDY